MENILNIADESSDDEGFEVDENEVDGANEEVVEEENSTNYDGEIQSFPSSSSPSHVYTSERMQTFPNSGDPQPTLDESPNHDRPDENDGDDNDAVDSFALARKVPISHQVKNAVALQHCTYQCNVLVTSQMIHAVAKFDSQSSRNYFGCSHTSNCKYLYCIMQEPTVIIRSIFLCDQSGAFCINFLSNDPFSEHDNFLSHGFYQ